MKEYEQGMVLINNRSGSEPSIVIHDEDLGFAILLLEQGLIDTDWMKSLEDLFDVYGEQDDESVPYDIIAKTVPYDPKDTLVYQVAHSSVHDGDLYVVIEDSGTYAQYSIENAEVSTEWYDSLTNLYDAEFKIGEKPIDIYLQDPIK